MTVKDIIKSRRIELGLTMKDVAEKVGVSEATVSRWESGDIENMRRDKIMSLAKALDISPAIIMGWDNSEEHDLLYKKMYTSDESEQTSAQSTYYNDPETAKVAQAVFSDPNLRLLFDAAEDCSPDQVLLAAEMLKKFKEGR